MPQEVPYLRTQRRTPERRADAATEALRPVKGHGGAALDGGGLPAGVREVLSVTAQLNGELICTDCLEANHKKCTEDYIE